MMFKNVLPAIALSIAAFPAACGSSGAPTAPTALTAATTSSISGAVFEVTAAGTQPVEGVQVEEAATHLRAMSDASGAYRIAGLQALSSSISAMKPGYTTTSSPVLISGDTHLDLQIDRVPTYTLTGLVSESTAAGRVPVSGVHIVLGEGYPDLTAITDAGGRFSIAGIGATTWGLTASKDGYDTLLMSVAVASDTSVEITLTRLAGDQMLRH